ncbi:MAG TPA: c-type cytochrome [Xanthobacteraceae bacterium]|nr:c-type cytochrome [Xanthobacteraceae bacterium]
MSGGGLRRFLVWALAALAAAAAGALLLAWSGLYNIAASSGHWRVVEWFLAFGMSNSVELRAHAIEVPATLDDPNLVRLGAAHFQNGCALCHGAPGAPPDPTVQRMLPSPPDLADVVPQWRDAELFWIVKHGIKYTGMPAWLAQQRDDEVWAVVAFLKRLPQLDAEAYRALALGERDKRKAGGWHVASAEGAVEAVGMCQRCHGAAQAGPPSNLVPLLHGQSRAFLAQALTAYAQGRRASGIMQTVVAELNPAAIQNLAKYYSELRPPAATKSVDPRALQRGAALAVRGDPRADIPACTSCHGDGALAIYPRLAGQHAPYMAGRLRLWKQGMTAVTPTEKIMAPIARRMSDQQINDLAAYFAALTPQEDE